MTELKNLVLELDRFRLRVFAAAAFVFFGFSLLTARLVYLQVMRHDELSTRAEANRIAVVPIVPNRGPHRRPQRRGGGHQLHRLHAGDHALQDREPGGHHRRAGPGHRDLGA